MSTNYFQNKKYGPYSINIWRANPPAVSAANLGAIDQRMMQILSGGYQTMMYFAPASLEKVSTMEGYANGNIGTINGVKRTQAQYLSLFSRPLFGYDVIYQGQDYPQDWVRR
jgi:hypothetical protein